MVTTGARISPSTSPNDPVSSWTVKQLAIISSASVESRRACTSSMLCRIFTRSLTFTVSPTAPKMVVRASMPVLKLLRSCPSGARSVRANSVTVLVLLGAYLPQVHRAHQPAHRRAGGGPGQADRGRALCRAQARDGDRAVQELPPRPCGGGRGRPQG